MDGVQWAAPDPTPVHRIPTLAACRSKEASFMTQSLGLFGALRRGPLALLLPAATVTLAACNQVGTNTITFWDIVFSMVAFFFWFMFIWMFISVFGDIFRRNDLSGGAKVVWLVVIVVLPFLGILIYLGMRPKVTAQDVQMMPQVEAQTQAAQGVSTADELEIGRA